ncbi:thioredoxin family protein [Motiliproteus sp. SC1-56]|uniref:thioredoxin family protein n=1 Tax=Motiliproteus sp. SC1-56 TaxID=2799565 RepID=UPI001A8CCA89|nr:thioredoxin family protein [Motiliproteus sp. SC1-56]
MALTESSMMTLGTVAPDFALNDPRDGKRYALEELMGERGTLVMFICNHCPFVKHVESALVRLGEDYRRSGIALVAISANDADAYPEDSPEMMAQKRYPFPYLYDADQQVARAYGAACTPDFFLFDSELRCVYRGQFDSARPGNDAPVTGADLRRALEALRHGEPVDKNQKPSIGCNIKWKA